MRWKHGLAFLAIVVLAAVPSARAELRITEWMYQGANGEFVEWTNMGPSPVNLTGYYYTDTDENPFDIDLSELGTIAVGESFILTDAFGPAFSAAWALGPEVKVKGGNSDSNLGRNDEINIYHGLLVDRLKYGDQDFPGTIRTQNRSGNPMSLAGLGANNPSLWALGTNGDVYGSHVSSGGDVGNPGFFYLAPDRAGTDVVRDVGARLGGRMGDPPTPQRLV